ncbi:hypothetical protein [Streptomyces sp. NBC_00887]|nr:hypothetical protein OG844_01570 [Streptomyces sp. NBC_00887]WSY36157.1 hypothetical protein OG844_44030 [Streptomyces sp. NBC_00887]
MAAAIAELAEEDRVLGADHRDTLNARHAAARFRGAAENRP